MIRGIRIGIVGAVLCAAAGAAIAQQAKLEAYVPNTEIVQDRPFWLIVEASGVTVETPEVTSGDDVVINTASPNMQTQFSMSGRDQQQSVRLSYNSTAIRAGEVVIPPVRARINGRVLETEPITLQVKPAPPGQAPDTKVRAWVSSGDVTVGEELWIFIEATGIGISLPDTVAIDWATIDPTNTIRSTSFSVGHQGQRTTEKIGYLAIPTDVGTFTVPPIEVKVTGRVVKTEPIEVTVHKQPVKTGPPEDPPPNAELTQDDLVFITMDVDKKTIYQGEPLLLSMQLWRIRSPRITSGPYRGALIYGPSTEGFFVRELEPRQYESRRGPWSYDVTETLKLLYPTRSGVLTIGTWHWEGIALINRQSILQRDKLYYRFDAGPIDVAVLPLPPSPPGFSGGVGQFEASAELSPSVVVQGVPLSLTVRVEGFGNPDAVGDPILPELAWATAREPQRQLTFASGDGNPQPRMIKQFTFPVTPLRAGRMVVPEFPFVYFDPDEAGYVSKKLGPFSVDVVAPEEDSTFLLTSPEVPAAERRVEILAEDIRPMADRPSGLRAQRDASALWFLPFLLPVLAYAVLAFAIARARYRRSNVAWARSQQAHGSGIKRLRNVSGAAEPADALYRALITFVGDALNLDGTGMTSADVARELGAAGLGSAERDKVVQILRACERARYASQRLSDDEMMALISGAEASMDAIDRFTRSGGSR